MAQFVLAKEWPRRLLTHDGFELYVEKQDKLIGQALMLFTALSSI